MKTDQEIKELLSKELYSIQDVTLQTLVRNVIFVNSKDVNWQAVYKTMLYLMPELQKYA